MSGWCYRFKRTRVIVVVMFLGVLFAGCGDNSTEQILCGGPCPVKENPDNGGGPLPEPGPAHGIRLVSAVPSSISIQGAGGVASSILTFIVTDGSGQPSADVGVSFSVNNTIGKLSLTDYSGTTRADGLVSTALIAGTTATTVTVTATVDATTMSTQSRPFVISTGVADADSFSLSADKFNPHGFNFNGAIVNFTVRLADVNNNPSPDGVQVKFETDSGVIESRCKTVGGACSVKWWSGDPRLPGDLLNKSGRVYVLAYTDGAESFIDNNGDGVFDSGDTFPAENDLPDPWADRNKNGIWDEGEKFGDTNANGTGDGPDGLYSGPFCTYQGLCSDRKSIKIGSDFMIVMSSDKAELTSADIDADLEPDKILNIGQRKKYEIFIGDINGNSLPGGSKIVISTDVGKIVSKKSYTISNAVHDPLKFDLMLTKDKPGIAVGTLLFVITAGPTESEFMFPITTAPAAVTPPP